jgi:RNA polymerase sigma-70 factor (ECF subfamily)
MPDKPFDPIPTRHSLLARLKDLGDQASWQEFFETYWRLIYNVAFKAGLTDAESQEVVQETVIAIARKIPDFRYDPAKGSFKQWLLLICRRRIQDHLRRVYTSRLTPQTSGDHDLAEHAASEGALPHEEMERNLEEAWRDNIFERALARVKQRANPKSFQVFDCVVLRNMAPTEVASMLGLNAAQVYLAKHRVSAAVKRAAKLIEQELCLRERVR